MVSEIKQMAERSQATLLVTGASGQLGRRVIELLQETYNGPIIAATRTPAKLSSFGRNYVSVRRADFEDPASLDESFAGVDRLLLISTDAVDIPGRRIQQHVNAVKAAERAGVKHVVYTSIIHSGPESPAFVVPDHVATEAALAESSLGWTVLRENIYMDLQLMSLGQALQSGTLANAIDSGKAAYITREDCARAAAAALSSSFEGRRTLEITGPEAVSQEEIAALASQISGKEIRYVPLDVETLVGYMTGAGMPRPVAEAYATFDTAIAQGEFDAVSSAVEDLTGRKPQSIGEFLSAHREVLLNPAQS
jgi:NAD(P)H dehydrogenase (quinone)